MIKGIPQAKRNNAWHTKHTKKVAGARLSRYYRLLNKKNGVIQSSAAERNFRLAQSRERQKTVGLAESLKYKWLRAKAVGDIQFKRLFSNTSRSNA